MQNHDVSLAWKVSVLSTNFTQPLYSQKYADFKTKKVVEFPFCNQVFEIGRIVSIKKLMYLAQD